MKINTSGRFGLFRNSLAPAVFCGTLACSGSANALSACATEGGTRSMPIYVSSISPADVTNGSESAWIKIAEAAQAQHGNAVSTGFVTMTIYTTVLGVRTAVPGSFPWENSGLQSLQKGILDYRGIQNSNPDPKPCDPSKNSCCEECCQRYGQSDSATVYKAGYMSHKAVVANRSSSTRRRAAGRHLLAS